MPRQEELAITAEDGASLVGTLTLPARERDAPAIVAVHGASTGTRGAATLRHLPTLIPPTGVATLVFDRRGEGASSGTAHLASFERLADDVQAVVAALRAHPRVDAERLGLWCFSQGGWIAPIVAARDPRIACLVAVSPCGVTPAAQMRHAVARQLADAGYPAEVAERVLSLRTRFDDLCRRRRGDTLRGERHAELALLPEPGSETQQWEAILDFDVRAWLRQLNLPILVVAGSRDRWVPGARADVRHGPRRPGRVGATRTALRRPADQMGEGTTCRMISQVNVSAAPWT